MEWKFSPARLALLTGLIIAFWYLAGSRLWEMSETVNSSPRRLAKAWSLLIFLYLGGAVLVSVVDCGEGTIDRKALRRKNIMIGFGCMIGSIIVLRA